MPNANGPTRLAKLTLALAVASASIACGSSEGGGVLRLQDGSHLAGRWLPGDQSEALLWRADFAEGTYRFPWSAVSQVVLPETGRPATPVGSFRFELVGGDSLRGDLVRVDEEWLTIQASLGGPTELRLRRSAVRRLVAMRGESEVVYQGPDAPDAWTTESPEDWRLTGGALVTAAEQATIYRNIELPERFVLELDLSWDKQTDFEFQLAVPEKATPVKNKEQQRRRQMRGQRPVLAPVGGYALRTVGGVLVVTRELKKTADIQPLLELPTESGSFSCLLYGDQPAGRLLVTTPRGETLAEIAAEDPAAAAHSGVRLTNFRGGVRLKSLRASVWDGSPPVATGLAEPGLINSAGEFTPGELIGFEPTEQTLVLALPAVQASDDSDEAAPDEEPEPSETEQEGEAFDPPADEAEEKGPETRELPADRIASVIFKNAAAEVKEEPVPDAVTLVGFDGTQLSGSVLSVEGVSIRFASGALDGEIEVPMTAIREVRARQSGPQKPGDPTPETPLLLTDSSRVNGQMSHGATTDSASCLVWRPVGCGNALPLLHDVRGRLILRPARKQPAATPARAEPQRPAQNGILGAVFGLFGGGQNAGQASETALQTMRGLGYASSVYLRGGDRIPCRVRSVGPEGLAVESRFISNDLIAPEHLKAIELKTAGVDGKMVSSRRERLLTLPRMQQDDPPTHLLVSSRGDYLRCRLIRLDDRHATVEVHLEERQIDRSRIARIIWLDPPSEEGEAGETPQEPVATARLQVQALRRDGVRMTMRLDSAEANPDRPKSLRLVGFSPAIGDCQIELADLETLQLGPPDAPPSPKRTYQLWSLRPAKTPREDPASDPADSSGGSTLVGQPAPDLELPWARNLEGPTPSPERFELSALRGRVVVLDFWASWCGPCIRSMPGTKQLVDEFADRDVLMVGVNLQDSPEEVAASLKRMGLSDLPVALDRDGVAAQRYEVTGIPQTVVIGRDGRIASVLIGGDPEIEQRLREAIETAAAVEAVER